MHLCENQNFEGQFFNFGKLGQKYYLVGNRKHPQRFVSGRVAFSNWQLLAPCLLLLWIGGYGQHLTLSRQFIFDEMSRMGANTFLEDSYGFIWIGAGGLYRYDGYTIQPYRPVLHDSAGASAGAGASVRGSPM